MPPGLLTANEPAAAPSAARAGKYLRGMAKVKGKVKIRLDIDKVLSAQELHGLNGLPH